MVTDDDDHTPFRILIAEELNQYEKCKKYGHNSDQSNTINKLEQTIYASKIQKIQENVAQ